MKDREKTKDQILEELNHLRHLLKESSPAPQGVADLKDDALTVEQSEWKKTFDTMPDIIAILNYDHTLLRTNQAMSARLGLSPEEMLGRKCYEIVHGLNAPPDFCPLVKSVRDGREHFVEITEPLLGGTFLVSSTPCSHKNSATQKAVHVARDITERKKVEEALRESESLCRLVIEAMVDVVWTTDLTLRATYVSPSVERLLGFTPEERMKQTIEEMVTPESLKRIQETLALELQKEEEGTSDPDRHVTIEIEYYKKGGGTIWAENIIRAIRDSQGVIIGIHGLSRDLTERKKIEEALRESEERFRLAMEATSDGLWDWDITTGNVYRSPEFFKMLSYEPDDFPVGFDGWNTLVHPDDVAGTINALEDCPSGRTEKHEVQFRMLASDGHPVWIQSRGKVIARDEDGKPVRMVGIYTDITRRIEAEQKLTEQLSMISSLFENASEGICVCHNIAEYPFVKFTHWNARMTEYTGYTMEEMNRLGWYQTMYPDPEIQNKAIERMNRMRQGDDLKSEEWQITTKEGNLRPLSISTSIINDTSGETHVLAVMQDLTVRKNLEAQLLQSQKMEAIGTLAAGIAHDFNNMLQVILGYSDLLLLGKKSGEPGYQELQKIIKTCHEARDLVQKIRLVSRRADIQTVPCDLNQDVEPAVLLLKRSLAKTIKLSTHLTRNLALVKADPALMKQIVMNLCINSIEAMPEGGALTIRTENVLLDDTFCKAHVGLEPGLHVLLTVSDTGRGITKDVMDRIFDPFYSTKVRDYHKGTGLGLPVVGGIVELHKGCVDIESEAGKGTTFKIYLPAIAAIEPTSEGEEIQPSPRGTETIFLVEDEKMVRNLGICVLEQFGYRVLAAADGQQALQVYEREKESISLVILDIIMPRMNGKQCFKELLRINPNVKVLVSSGVAKDELVQEVVNLGAKGSLVKPFNVMDLLQKVREVLDADCDEVR